MPSFGERLAGVFLARGHLCLGIDPHAFLLEEWGLPDSAEGAREFGLRVVESAADRVGIVKPQIAFFERHGSAGYAALEAVLGAARDAGLLVIADAKRGDIGSTVAAYGESWLTPGSPLEVDAMTIAAFQGVGSLEAPIALAREHDKGLFILAATSNPEAFSTQTAVRASGTTVAAGIVDDVHDLNADAGTLGSFGVVIGATARLSDFGIAEEHLRRTPILGPGFGEQGALVSDLGALFGAVAGNVLASVSRGALRAGPAGLIAALDRLNGELREAR